MTTHIKMLVSYDGTCYSGFQVQNNAPTIQGELERVLQTLYKQSIRITGAGRTDAGVHARGQVISYQPPFDIPVNKLPAAVNSLLPGDIVVTEAAAVSSKFHARYDARRKIYSFTIDRAPWPQIMMHRYAWHYPKELDLPSMQAAARQLEGKHDFRMFQAAGSAVLDTVRTLYNIEIRECRSENLLRFWFEGDGFLYRMVRLITGSLIRVGRGKLKPADMRLALEAYQPGVAGPTAPPHGLCLEQVIYDP